jgi:hypothetical protein
MGLWVGMVSAEGMGLGLSEGDTCTCLLLLGRVTTTEREAYTLVGLADDKGQ